jgi:alpha-1,2-mannosyltransferase
VILAAIGAILLVVVAFYRWAEPQDEHSYWLAGRHVLVGETPYDPTASVVDAYVYRYPPPLAQLLAPITAILPSNAFSWAWTGLLLGCLLWMSGGRPLISLAFIAFVPVAVELYFRNAWIPIAAILALGVVRWPWLFAIGAHLKLAPVLGILYLVLRRRWRDAALAIGLGAAILAVSYALDPSLWTQFIEITLRRGVADESGILALPYGVRLAGGVILTVVAAVVRPRIGEPLLLVAIVVAAPTLWLNAFSMLIAIVPIVRSRNGQPAMAPAGR